MHTHLGIGACLVTAVSASASAQNTTWTFETTQPLAFGQTAGPYVAEVIAPFVSTANASGFHASASTLFDSREGNGSNNSFYANRWAAGDYYQFDFSSLGYLGIGFSWMQTRTSTGPATFDLLFRVGNSGPFTTILDDYSVPVVAWSSQFPVHGESVFPEVGLPMSSWGQPLIQVRLVAQVDGSAVTGSTRIDNVVFHSRIPAPGALALFGLGGLVVARRRRGA